MPWRLRTTRSLGLAALGVAMAAAPSAGANAPAGPDLVASYRRHAGAIVYVRATYTDGPDTRVNSGAGAILTGGRILTACHVVRHGADDKTEVDTVEVIVGKLDAASGMVREDRRLKAKVVRCDLERDLALLRPDEALPKGPRLRVAGDHATVGQAVAALGHSWRGLPWTIHGCSIAGRGQPVHDGTSRIAAVRPDDVRAKDEPLMLEVECDSHPLSGSVIVDVHGKIVGLRQFVQFDPTQPFRDEFSQYIDALEIRAFLEE